jgi:hypothetical protein
MQMAQNHTFGGGRNSIISRCFCMAFWCSRDVAVAAILDFIKHNKINQK